MNKISKKHRKLKARETSDGAGARIKRLFPGPAFSHFDPFVLLDEFFVTPEAGFPEHPHQGFEAVTYMLEGAFRHKDNLSNDSVVSAGGVQRFSAGKEIRHAEMPGTDGMNHGLQLWINLPRDMKDSSPTYQQVNPKDIPVESQNGVEIRTIIGNDSPVAVNTNVLYQD